MGTQGRLPTAQPPGRWLMGRKAPRRLQPPPAQDTPEHGHAGLGDEQVGRPAWGWALRSVRPDSSTKVGPRPAWRSGGGHHPLRPPGSLPAGRGLSAGQCRPCGQGGAGRPSTRGRPSREVEPKVVQRLGPPTGAGPPRYLRLRPSSTRSRLCTVVWNLTRRFSRRQHSPQSVRVYSTAHPPLLFFSPECAGSRPSLRTWPPSVSWNYRFKYAPTL